MLEGIINIFKNLIYTEPPGNDFLTNEPIILEYEGCITSITDEFGVIDNRTVFKISLCSEKLKVSDKVTYRAYWPSDDEDESSSLIVVSIRLFENEDWVDADTFTYEYFTIVHREGKRITLCNNNELNLDKIRVEGKYVPYSGDLVKLTTDEGGIITIMPTQSMNNNGIVSCFKNGRGSISPNIEFTIDELEGGFEPLVGDVVAFTAVKTDAIDKSEWRAISVSFEGRQEYEDIARSEIIPLDDTLHTYGISIRGSCDFGDVLIDSRGSQLKLEIANVGAVENKLESVLIRRQQVQITIENVSIPVVLPPGERIAILFNFKPKFVGRNSEIVDFHFKEFTVSRRLTVTVIGVENMYDSNLDKQLWKKSFKGPAVRPDGNIKRTYGKKALQKSFFRKRRSYHIPKSITDFCYNHDGIPKKKLHELARSNWPEITDQLDRSTYARKFHSLLYFEQMAHTIAASKMGMKNVFLRRRGEYLVLDVPGLQEQRPSLIIGDSIIVTQPWREKEQIAHVGFIQQISRDSVAASFDSNFLYSYDETVCNVEFEPRLSVFSHEHEAVDHVNERLSSIIFPEIVYEKEPFINSNTGDMVWFNKMLNTGQKTAVMNALQGKCRPLPYVIFGPPGTGKTVTLVECILQITRLSGCARILVAAPSNSSADLLCTRLIESGKLTPDDLIRLMAFSRNQETIPEELIPYGTTISSDEGVAHSNVPVGWQRIIVGTCSSIAQLKYLDLPRGHFTHVVLDEAGYCTEPATNIPLSFLSSGSGMAILAGDPKQLGPVILSSISLENGLGESLIARIMDRFPYARNLTSNPDSAGFDPRLITCLTQNYRSVERILSLPNKLFYNSELVATVSEDSVREREIILGFHEVCKFLDTASPIMFHGVRGENIQEADSPSWYNPHEVFETTRHIRTLYGIGVDPSEIAVISPYRKQVLKIRQFLTAFEEEIPKIGSVEELQGQERQVIILSCVRSGADQFDGDRKFNLGFLTNPRRLNVALTRAKCLLIIIGDPYVLATDVYWRSVIRYCLHMKSYFGCGLPNLSIFSADDGIQSAEENKEPLQEALKREPVTNNSESEPFDIIKETDFNSIGEENCYSPQEELW